MLGAGDGRLDRGHARQEDGGEREHEDNPVFAVSDLQGRIHMQGRSRPDPLRDDVAGALNGFLPRNPDIVELGAFHVPDDLVMMPNVEEVTHLAAFFFNSAQSISLAKYRTM